MDRDEKKTPMSPRGLSRRDLLVAAVQAGGVLAALAFLRRPRALVGPSGSVLAPALVLADEPLGGQQLDTLIALGHVLLPSSFAANPATADPVIAEIVNQHLARVPAALAAFGDAAAVLDEASVAQYGTGFAQLELARRRQLVADILTPYTSRRLFARPYYALTAQGDRIRRLWSDVSHPIIVGFYNSAEGWRVVGYTRRPGQCSNLTDYQFAPV